MKKPYEPVNDEDANDALYFCRQNLERVHAFMEGMLSQMDEDSHSFNKIKNTMDVAVTNSICYVNTIEATIVKHEMLIKRLGEENEKLNQDLDTAALTIDKLMEQKKLMTIVNKKVVKNEA